MPDRPVLIRKQDAPAIYGFTLRQLKRWIVEKRISHVHPSGEMTGFCYLLTAELDALIQATTTPATRRARAAR